MRNYVHIKYYACICTFQCSTWEILWITCQMMKQWQKWNMEWKEEQKGTGSPPREASPAPLRWPLWLCLVDSVLGSHWDCYVIVAVVVLEGLLRTCLFQPSVTLPLAWSWGSKPKEIVQRFFFWACLAIPACWNRNCCSLWQTWVQSTAVNTCIDLEGSVAEKGDKKCGPQYSVW